VSSDGVAGARKFKLRLNGNDVNVIRVGLQTKKNFSYENVDVVV
jgi:hypothetical protein